MRIYSESEIRRSFGDLRAHRAARDLLQAHSTNPADIRALALDSIDFSKVRNVLDLGCGFGFFSQGLRGRIAKGTHIVGLDVQDAYQRPFLETCWEIGAGGEFHLADAAELASFPDHVFDLILSSYSLYFFPETVEDIARVLTAEGTFVALTHSDRNLCELIRHIPPVLESMGVAPNEQLSIQKLLRVFSLEHGRGLLDPCFATVEVQAYPNNLAFGPHTLDRLRPYLQMKQNLLLKEVADRSPDRVGVAVDRLLAALGREAGENERLEINKDDAIFTCRKPRVVRARPVRTGSPRFCTNCGGRLEVKIIEGRKRPFCVACGTIAYGNPLPVVAAIVANASREVLLVRRARQPMKGMWCLPTGFAENDERIEEAVLRELHEETGLYGRVRRLLDASTTHSYFYGNLVMLSYEIVDVQGVAVAGDDAEAVAWFPLSGLPPLAFHSHEHALQKFAESHQEDWAIQDSSVVPLPDREDTRAHLSDARIAAVQRCAEDIARAWLEAVAVAPDTRHYRSLPAADLHAWARLALSHLGEWLRSPGTSPCAASFLETVGRQRAAAEIPLEESMRSLRILRDCIIAHGRASVDRGDLLSLYAATEFDLRIMGFFDHALVDLARKPPE